MATDETQSQAAKPDKDESKDFVEHLRTVHFTLLGTCLALFVIAVGSSTDKFKAAFDELDIVSDTAEAMKVDWSRETVTNFLALNQTCFDLMSEYALKDSPDLERNSAAWLIIPLTSEGQEGDSVSWLTDDSMYPKSRPKTLSEFKTMWDANIRIVCADAVFDVRGSDTDVQIDYDFTASPQKLQKTKFEGSPKEVLVLLSPVFDKRRGYHTIVRKVSGTVSQDFAVRDVIRTGLHNAQLPHREFKQAFYDLEQATAGVQEANFSLVRSFLELQKKNSADVFEAFGQKFPIDSAARWGVFIIVAIQLYFWLHFVEYRQRHFGKTNAAWIGLYSSKAARFLFCVTALAAPTGVIAFVCTKAGLLTQMPIRNFILCTVAVLMSLVFSFLTARQYFKRDAIIPANPN